MSSEISRIAVEGTPSSSLDTDRGRETDREASVSRWETGPKSRETDRNSGTGKTETGRNVCRTSPGGFSSRRRCRPSHGSSPENPYTVRQRQQAERQRENQRQATGGEAQAQRETGRQRDRRAGKQPARQPARQAGTRTHTHTHTERERERERQGERQKETEAETERQAAVEGGRIPCRRRRKCPHRPSRASGMPPSTQHSSQRSRCSQRATAGADFSCAAPSPCVRGCAWLPLSQPSQEFLLPPTRPEPLSVTLSVSLALAGSGWLLALALLLTRAGTAENPLCLSLSLCCHSTAPPAPQHTPTFCLSLWLSVCVSVSVAVSHLDPL